MNADKHSWSYLRSSAFIGGPSCPSAPWGGAAIGGAQREIRAGLALSDQFGQHGDHARVRAGSPGPDEVEAQIAAQGGSLIIQVVLYFHVVAQEAEGRDHHVTNAV